MEAEGIVKSTPGDGATDANRADQYHDGEETSHHPKSTRNVS